MVLYRRRIIRAQNAPRFGILKGSDLTYFGDPYLKNYSKEKFQILTRCVFESQLQMLLNKPFPKNFSLADIMEKAPKMFVMPLVEI